MTPEQAQVLRDYLVPEFNAERQITRKVLAAVPQETIEYKPSSLCMSGGELAKHIAGVELYFLNSIVQGQFAPPAGSALDGKTVAEMVEVYDEEAPKLLEQIRGLSPDHLAKTMKFYHFEWPAVTYLQFVMKHTIHHRGQLSAYLRPMGTKVPGIYGPSADDLADAAAAGKES